MTTREHRRLPLIGLVAALLALGGSAPAAAQDETPAAGFDPTARLPAHVHVGSCEAPGEIAFSLSEAGYGLPVPLDPRATTPATDAAAVGQPGYGVAAVSVTAVPASLDQLTGGARTVDVHAAAGGDAAENQLVCGSIGGFRNGDDLVFGLRERNGSGYVGTAWAHDNRDGTTTLALFLASGLADQAPPAASEAPPAATTTTTTSTTTSSAGAGAAPVVTAGEPIPTVIGDESIATDREALPEAAPSSLDDLPDDIEEATLPIAGGAFEVDELILRVDEPTVLHVVNGDGRPYLLAIGDLLPASAIAADGITNVEFTTPNVRTLEGALLDVDGEAVLDTVRIVIQAPGGVGP